MNLTELFYEYVRTKKNFYDGDDDGYGGGYDDDDDGYAVHTHGGHVHGDGCECDECASHGVVDADDVPELYAEWLNLYCEEIGQTPEAYIDRMRADGTLEDYAEQCFMSDWELDETVAGYLADGTHTAFLTLRLADADVSVALTAAKLLAIAPGRAAEAALLDAIMSPATPYAVKLVAYEALLEAGDHIVDEILKRIYAADADTQTMLIEIMARYKGNKAVYMWLVTLLYRGDEAALAASLLGAYGDEDAIDVLNSFAAEYELDANELTEVRNAVERLGGEFNENGVFGADKNAGEGDEDPE
ncbi:MAG: hypothetical protein LBT55_02110 [Clostridiaceae bacterium]|nr:hypothetical protein [Clostridiaceae bacterium]